MGVKEDLRIDVNHLDVEWGMLPELYHHYLEEQDLSEHEIKKLGLAIDLTAAELDKAIRKTPANYTRKETLTEPQIKAIVAMDPELMRMRTELLEKELYRKSVQSVCRALEFKKDALKQLVTLRTSEYFTQPTTDVDGVAYLRRQTETSKRQVRKDVKRNLRTRRDQNGQD